MYRSFLASNGLSVAGPGGFPEGSESVLHTWTHQAGLVLFPQLHRESPFVCQADCVANNEVRQAEVRQCGYKLRNILYI